MMVFLCHILHILFVQTFCVLAIGLLTVDFKLFIKNFPDITVMKKTFFSRKMTGPTLITPKQIEVTEQVSAIYKKTPLSFPVATKTHNLLAQHEYFWN